RRLQAVLSHLEDGHEAAPLEERVQPLLPSPVRRQPERLVPEAHAVVAELVTGPLLRAQGRCPAELKLGAVYIAGERLAGRAARHDPDDARLVVVLAQDVEVEVPADVLLGEEGELVEIDLPAYVVVPSLHGLHAA